MKKCSPGSPALLLVILLLIIGLPFSLPASAQEVPWTTGDWDAEEFGNHRARVQVTAPAEAVRVHIPWRRRDIGPESKNIIVVDAATGARITNLVRVEINREFGELVFEPQTAPGEYYVYYIPWESTGGSYPQVTYPEPEATAETGWLERIGLVAGQFPAQRVDRQIVARLPESRVIDLQAINELHSFFPMEVIATRAEVERLQAAYASASYLIFPEDRTRSIRMTDDLPYRWIESGPAAPLTGTALRGEYYAFQIGVYAMRQDLENLQLAFSTLMAEEGGGWIPASAFTCFNLPAGPSRGRWMSRRGRSRLSGAVCRFPPMPYPARTAARSWSRLTAWNRSGPR